MKGLPMPRTKKKWTTEKPSEPGYYFIGAPGRPPEIVCVVKYQGKLSADGMNINEWHPSWLWMRVDMPASPQ